MIAVTPYLISVSPDLLERASSGLVTGLKRTLHSNRKGSIKLGKYIGDLRSRSFKSQGRQEMRREVKINFICICVNVQILVIDNERDYASQFPKTHKRSIHSLISSYPAAESHVQTPDAVPTSVDPPGRGYKVLGTGRVVFM